MTLRHIAVAATVALIATVATAHAAANPAAAQEVTKACAASWKADKAANKVAPGQTWPKYLSECSDKAKGTTPAAVAAPAAPTAAKVEAKAEAKADKAAAKAEKAAAKAAAKAEKAAPAAAAAKVAPAKAAAAASAAPSAARAAETERMRECGRQWKADHAAGKTGTKTWPQYWSACSKRVK